MQVDITYLIGQWSFYIGAAALASIVVHAVFLLIFHFFMPQAVLVKYFKPPYFREMECMLFTGIPYAPIRTVMFMRVIAFPSSGKVRGITDAHLLVPNWYRTVSKVMIVIAFANMLVVLLCMLGIGLAYLNQGPT
jgi:hypothetical protein